MFKRSSELPKAGTETFSLWGPRQTGKTTLLEATYPGALRIDLLKAEEYRRYLQNPELLRTRLAVSEQPRQIVIDEIQKVPQLLDEVHWLHENRGFRFALFGSRARKVKRGHANLLGGRAIRYNLHGLTANEIGQEFDLIGAIGYRDGQLLDHCPRLRCIESHDQRPFSDTRRHLVRTMAASIQKAPQAPRDPSAEVLFRRYRSRQSLGAPRRLAAGIGTLRQGIRKLGLSRTLRL